MQSFFARMLPGPIVVYGYATVLVTIGFFVLDSDHSAQALSMLIGSMATYALARAKADDEEER